MTDDKALLVRLLVQLQEIDDKLRDLQDEEGDLPELIHNLEEEIAQMEEKIRLVENELKETAQLKILKQRTLDEARGQLKRSQSVLLSVKTSREYDAVSSEIEKAKGTIQETEKRLLELAEYENKLRHDLSLHQAQLHDKKKEYQERKAELEERLGESDEERLKLLHQREKVVVRLNKPVYAHYERIRQLRGGTAVAFIVNQSCSYCYARIPSQRQVDVRKMEDLYLCEVCGCYLVSREAVEQTRSIL